MKVGLECGLSMSYLMFSPFRFLSERVKAVRLLAEENEQLLRQRPELESAIVTMKNELVDVANAVDGAQNVNEAYRQRIQEMRGALVQFYLLARKQDLDLRLLTEEGAEAATRLASIPGSPTSRLANTRALGKSSIVDFEALPEMITPEEAVAFFLKLNGTAQELAPLDPDVDGCTVLQLPSLSQIDGSDLPMAPARPTDIEARRLAPHRCESCHVRQLPVTAPVMPAHRDRLLLCTTCGLRFHLCCVEPPLRELPEQEDSWACSFCVLGAALAMEVEEEEEAQRIAEDVAIAATSKSRPFRARRDSLSTETHMDMFFEDGYAHLEAEEAERQRRQLVQQQRVEIVQQRRNSLPARRRNNSTSSMQAPPTVKKARANRNSANAIEQNSAVATASPSIAAPALVTDKSLEEAKSVLKRIMGRAPACPTLLLQRQNIAKAEDVALRAFVHDIVSPEDHEQLKRHSMWRILNSVPPKTDPADVLALVREGAAVGFGKCLDAVEDPSVLASLNVDDFTFGDNNGNVMAIDRDASDRNLCDFTSTSGAELAATAAGPNSGLRPERQQTRWNGDLYKPLWTRGQGKAKEGWCGLCEPGIWLKTKTSVYWYHMHNYHGISSIAGDYFAPPTDYRSAPGTGLREAHCDQCKKWIPVQSEKPVNVEEIYWFKHAQKCHQATAEEE